VQQKQESAAWVDRITRIVMPAGTSPLAASDSATIR